MKDLFAHYLNWKGRLSRAGYWWAWLGVFLIGLVFSLLGTFVHEAVSYLGDLWSLVTLLPMFFAAMRRYHDSGKPGWLALLLSVLTELFMLIGLTVLIVSIAGLSVGAMDGEPGAAVALFGTSGIFLVLMLAGLVVNFIMLVLPAVLSILCLVVYKRGYRLTDEYYHHILRVLRGEESRSAQD